MLLHFIFINILITGPILAIVGGRRWSHSGLHLFNTVLLFVVMLLVYHFGYVGPQISIKVLCMIVKTNVAASMVLVSLQAVELFPTVVRMSGMGLCHIVAQVCIAILKFESFSILKCHCQFFRRIPWPQLQKSWSLEILTPWYYH